MKTEQQKKNFIKSDVSRSYYFVFYQVKRYGWTPKSYGSRSTGVIETQCQNVIDIHPIQFQLNCNEKYNKEHETVGGYIEREEYMVISWQKLSKKEYDEFNGYVG